MTITADRSQFGAGASLSNFPVLVRTTQAGWGVGGSGRVVNTASCCAATLTVPADFVFADCDTGTLYSWDWELYTSGTGESLVWVKVPTVNGVGSGSDTAWCAFYGKAATTTYQATASSTWDSGYKAVYHLAGSLNLNDSTANGATLSQTGAGFTATTGQMDGGVDGDGSLSGTKLSSTVTTTATMSYEIWVKSDQNTAHSSGEHIMNQIGSSSNSYVRLSYIPSSGTSGTLTFELAGTGNTYTVGLQNWTYLSATNNPGGNALLYTNGVQRDTDAALTITGASNILNVGARDGTSPIRAWDGQLDEIRFSDTVRTADWLLASYNTQKASPTALTYGTETSCGGATPTPGKRRPLQMAQAR